MVVPADRLLLHNLRRQLHLLLRAAEDLQTLPRYYNDDIDGPLIRWNDHPLMTKERVVAGLEAAARTP